MAASFPVTVITGPTASGKSALALRIAQDRGGVIVNADSIQLYDALPLLTARPGDADMARAPHRLYAALPPGDDCSAARWAGMALAEIDAARAAGAVPVVTGGTGLYLRALMHGFSPVPDVPAEIRAAAAARQREMGHPAFHAELARRDPAMAARLHPHDTQRLVRAWEVLDATGRSLAYWQSRPPVPPALADGTALAFDVHVFDLPRALLHERCDRRFAAMVAGGALDEVAALAALIDSGAVRPDAAITHALGFAALRDHLAGTLSLADAMLQAQAQTRQYLKRQCTWQRHQILGDGAPRGTIASLAVIGTPA
jgi:tRNA dimethylallyltransferase